MNSVFKRVFCLLWAIGLCLHAAIGDDSSLVPDYHALIVGINKYQPTTKGAMGWTSLRSARSDAEELGRLLRTEYGFKVDMLLDQRATLSGMHALFDKLMDYDENDAVLIYFSGHGFYDEQLKTGYWIPADANKSVRGRYERSRWLPNSTLEGYIYACKARHVLLVSDACFSGSLFRSGATPNDVLNKGDKDFWRKRQLSRQSRYILTSGDMEAVGDNSQFAVLLRAYLRDGERPFFAASELAEKVLPSVATLTGQMGRYQPMQTADNRGGQFVFVRKGSDLPAGNVLPEPVAVESAPPPEAAMVGTDALDLPAPNALLHTALLMNSRGGSRTAERLLRQLATQYEDEPAMQGLVSQLLEEAERDVDPKLLEMLKRLQDKMPDGDNQQDFSDYARPRIVYLTEPIVSGDPNDEGEAILIHRLLTAGLRSWDGATVVNRRRLEQALLELEIGTSNLADARSQLEAKLLPASVLVTTELLQTGSQTMVSVVLEDTESTREFASWIETIDTETAANTVTKIGDAVRERLIRHKQLEARVLASENGRLTAGCGRFHGALPKSKFDIILKKPVLLDDRTVHRDVVVGEAVVVALHEDTAEFTPAWEGKPLADLSNLWVRERLP